MLPQIRTLQLPPGPLPAPQGLHLPRTYAAIICVQTNRILIHGELTVIRLYSTFSDELERNGSLFGFK